MATAFSSIHSHVLIPDFNNYGSDPRPTLDISAKKGRRRVDGEKLPRLPGGAGVRHPFGLHRRLRFRHRDVYGDGGVSQGRHHVWGGELCGFERCGHSRLQWSRLRCGVGGDGCWKITNEQKGNVDVSTSGILSIRYSYGETSSLSACFCVALFALT